VPYLIVAVALMATTALIASRIPDRASLGETDGP
jgi:hypothetical protein